MGGAVSVNAQTTDWNFSNWEKTTLTSTYTQDGLTIYANSDADVTIDGNKKSIDGVDYTQRLKLGGAGTFDDNGTPSARVIAFDVAGDCTIYMALMSSSSSAIRTVYVDANVNGTKINVATYNDVQGESIESRTINYTGDAGTIYIYSKSGGVNFYDIKYTGYKFWHYQHHNRRTGRPERSNLQPCGPACDKGHQGCAHPERKEIYQQIKKNFL